MSNHIPYSVSGPMFHASAFLLIFVALLELFLLVGCGLSPADQASINANQTPLTITPTTIDFGMMMPGSQPSTYPVIFINTSPNTVSIDSISVSPTGVFGLRG